MEPEPGAGEPATPIIQGWQKWAAAVLIILAGVAIAAIALPGLFGGAPETPQPILTIPGTTPVPTAPVTLSTPASPGTTPVMEVTPTPEGTPAPVVETTPACVPAGEPGFTVAVSPAEATAARGETVTYHMNIEAQNCFSQNVSMTLTASVLFVFRNTYDLGTQAPPYPKTFEYVLTVPDSLFPGATVDGILTSTGGGITRENRLVLHVR